MISGPAVHSCPWCGRSVEQGESCWCKQSQEEAIARIEKLEKVLVAAKRLREVQRMCHVPRQVNEGEALLELDNALRDAGYGVMR